MAGFSQFGQVSQGINTNTAQLQQLQDQKQQMQARAALAQLIQQLGQKQNPQGGPQGGPQVVPPNAFGPQQPGVTPNPVAVSPQGGGASAATGGAPGGAAPMPAGIPGGGASPAGGTFGIDPSIIQKMAQMKNVSPGAMGYLIENVAGLSKQPNANATRLEIGNMNEQGRNDRAQLSANTRFQIANQTSALRREIANTTGSNAKLKDDAQFRSLEDELNGAKTVYNANPTDDNLQAYHDAAKSLSEYAKGKVSSAGASGGTAPGKKPAAAKPTANAPAAPGQGDIDYLKANPDQRANFDAAFGTGAATKILGQ